MKKIVLLLSFFFIFTGQALAAPIILKSPLNPDRYAMPILIYSDRNLNAYISDDMIMFNLVYTDYLQNGNFHFTVYIEPTNENLRQEYAAMLKNHISNRRIEILRSSYPDLLQYVASDIYFDMKNDQAVITREMFIDRDGDFIAARKGFREVTSFDDEKMPGLREMAKAAIAILEQERNNPKTADYLHYMGKLPANKENKAKSRDDQYYDSLFKGIDAVKSKNYDQAIEHLNHAISIDPNNYKAYGWMGDACSRKKNYSEAINNYDKAISLNNREPILYENRGDVYLKKEQYTIALSDFEHAMELYGTTPTPSLCFRKALTHEKLGQTEEAVAAYLTFLEHNNGEGRLSNDITEYAREYIMNTRKTTVRE